MEHAPADLDEMIAREKKLVAIEYHNEAWADGISEGIEPEILAEAAFTTALTELIREAGDDCALELIEKMREQIVAGTFLPQRILQ
ncbi:hypothetical protein Brsp06_04094 [Brucella sp. NBRC 13694]|jgi:hypothetical protein|uniref:Uncharacterized protein n=8 Tax=Brucella TaxID=234 RepID=A6X275_BRUA4|nr:MULTISPECIES: hypothetical protein [Brucella/Ochrobactrum group]ABS15329.1 conserved hypothetical protein [Brucella anthropi ATCC 49188]MBB4092944.1 hypothetical protein [Brucella pecoris]MCH4539643.1 hypothetical protein [Ochrobactrum sp. A-1]NIH77180.1 hypothetical protein [Ochrobactrum sp. P20RRXII]OYR28348.1 hypothetical protein CES86_2963 [Brucella lupini]QOD64247.1 hypothetical protein HGK82_03030 [Ochrobactrum sp. MT180101]UYT57434.1 hypothetical protein OHI65_13125 [Brucella sp. M